MLSVDASVTLGHCVKTAKHISAPLFYISEDQIAFLSYDEIARNVGGLNIDK